MTPIFSKTAPCGECGRRFLRTVLPYVECGDRVIRMLCMECRRERDAAVARQAKKRRDGAAWKS